MHEGLLFVHNALVGLNLRDRIKLAAPVEIPRHQRSVLVGAGSFITIKP